MQETDLFLIFTRRLDEIGVRYMVTGSVAAIAYGEPRLTHDVDIVVELDDRQIARMPSLFPQAEFYFPPPEVVRSEAARSQRGHFNIIHHGTGFKADIYLRGRDPLHAWGLANVRKVRIGEADLSLAPPEYVVVRKLEFYREGGSRKHIRDIRGILNFSASSISLAEIERWVESLGLREAWAEVRQANEA